MINRGSPRALGRGVVIGHLVVVAVFVIIYLTFRSGVVMVAAALPVATILIGMRLHAADRLPWRFMLAGLALLSVVNIDSFIGVELLGDPDAGESLLNEIMQAGGYVAVLAASVVIVLRHAPQDAGGVIDAALIGVGAAAPLWEFVLRPRMLATGASTMAQNVLLIETLVLLAALGSLLRISRTTRRARAPLTYFFVALAATLTGLMLSATRAVPEGINGFVDCCWILGYLSIAAAPLHPGVASLTEPENWRPDDLSRLRLTRLGAVMLLIPVAGGIPALYGELPDTMLLVLGPMITVPLVLTRIGQLITQRNHDQRLLAHQATHDELTGLANRRHLFALAGDATDGLRSGRLGHLSVLYLDLDGFKPINDQLGHDAGDHVLRVIGERLTASLREDDTVGRIGGDEFLALCPDAGPAEAAALRRRIEQTVEQPVTWRGAEVRIGVTVGLAVAAPGSPLDSADALIAAADQDMYARKRARHAARAASPRVDPVEVGAPRPEAGEVDGVPHTVRS